MLLDVFHAKIDGWLFDTVKFNNYFSGEVWFSISASYIAALPGIFCGIFALVQTKRLNELEDRYHRPTFKLREATSEIVWIRDRSYKGIIGDYEKQGLADLMLADKNKCSNMLTLSMKLDPQNDIEVKKIDIEKVTFELNGCEYQFLMKEYQSDSHFEAYNKESRCKFDRGFEDDQYFYRLKWDLYPYIFVESGDNSEEEFWDGMEYFTNFANRLDESYRMITIKFEGKIYYEYARRGFDKITGNINWDCQNGSGRIGIVAKNTTNNGYFSYIN